MFLLFITLVMLALSASIAMSSQLQPLSSVTCVDAVEEKIWIYYGSQIYIALSLKPYWRLDIHSLIVHGVDRNIYFRVNNAGLLVPLRVILLVMMSSRIYYLICVVNEMWLIDLTC